MNRFLAFILTLALAGGALAEDPAKTEAKKPALNLRLDDTSSAAPRINFEQRPSSQTKEEREKGLPELGGKPSQAYDRPTSNSRGSVVPKAFDSNLPADQQ
ncbi:MAG TPA: hypothetical protein VNU64_15520 [Burkholderiales bacterium]|nr:hypothetical protein [Burkholderiales bacterium]